MRSKQVIEFTGDFKSELSAAMVEIRREFAALNSKKKTEMQSWYMRKVTYFWIMVDQSERPQNNCILQVEELRESKSGPFLEEHKRLNLEIETLRGRMTEFETRVKVYDKKQTLQFICINFSNISI